MRLNAQWLIRAFALTVLGVFALPMPVLAQCEVERLFGSDTDEQDEFGESVSIDGDFAAVGAINVPSPTGFDGAVYIFQRQSGGTWLEIKRITAPDGGSGRGFAWSLSLRGDLLVVGAPFDNQAASHAGAAYVFQRELGGPDNWGFVRKIIADDAASSDRFGESVAVDGELTLIGAPRRDTAGADAGAAYLFSRNLGGSNQWGLVRQMVASDASSDDFFGDSVSLSGDIALVGATSANGASAQSGAAYVFRRDEGGVGMWAETAKLFAPDGHGGDDFGISVSVNAGQIAIGAPDAETIYNDPGSAYIYEQDQADPSLWPFRQKLVGSDLVNTPDFGNAVDLRGDRLIVANLLDDHNAPNAGAAYLFARSEGGDGMWHEVHKFVASVISPSAYFGRSVAVSDDTAIIGSNYDNSRRYQCRLGHDRRARWPRLQWQRHMRPA
jgi:hypothetical protein